MITKTHLLFTAAFLLAFSLSMSGQEETVIFLQNISTSQKGHNYTCYQWNKPRNWGSRKEIDKADLTITYNYTFQVKGDDDLDTLSDMYELQIGKSVNRFFSLYSERVDSIAFNFLMSLDQRLLDVLTPDAMPGRLRQELYGWIPEGVCPLYNDVYTYPSENRRIISSRFHIDEYQYTETIEPFNWTLVEGTETILGLICNKAETVFRGRKWIAYYTFDLPYSYGPWKFCGLPGLIVKVADEEGLFEWEAVGIKTAEAPVYIYKEGYSSDKRIYGWIPDRKIHKCNRREMEHLWNRFWNAPLTIMLLDKTEAIFVDSNEKQMSLKLSDPMPDDYYPKLELDI